MTLAELLKEVWYTKGTDKTLNSSYTTGYVEKLTSTVGGSVTEYTYTYDAKGNITKIVYSTGEEIRYIYDDIGQLVNETNELLGVTNVYFYDNAGNITGMSSYALDDDGNTTQEKLKERSYGYSTSSWGDLLTSFNGISITYDNIGNPLTYYNGDEYIFSWTGRRLTGATKWSNTYSFTYNDDGIRTSKTVNGITTKYYLNGSQIVAEESDYYLTVYIYDASGSPIGMQYHGSNGYNETFWYEKNLQGDVVAVYDSAGVKMLSYTYDAWGNATPTYYDYLSSSLDSVNPFKYRGYYYDNDLGLYYLNSRYYDATVGRFINIDSLMSGTNGSLQGFNLYAYCFNNPVNLTDCNGNWPEWIENASTWVNDRIIRPVKNFFSPLTNTISGQFQDGIFRGSGALTGGYSEFNWRLDDKIKSSGSQDVWLGAFYKISVGNANGKIGIGNDNLSAYLKGVADGLVATAQAGLHYKNGFGVGAKAKAAVLSGRATTEFNIFGWQVELGVSGDILSVGADATIGIFPTDDGGKKFDISYGASPGLFGWGFVARVKFPG